MHSCPSRGDRWGAPKRWSRRSRRNLQTSVTQRPGALKSQGQIRTYFSSPWSQAQPAPRLDLITLPPKSAAGPQIASCLQHFCSRGSLDGIRSEPGSSGHCRVKYYHEWKVRATSTLSPNSSNAIDISTRCRVIRGCLRIWPPCCSPSWRTRWVRLPWAALHDLRRVTCKAAPNHPRPSVLQIRRAIGVRVRGAAMASKTEWWLLNSWPGSPCPEQRTSRPSREHRGPTRPSGAWNRSGVRVGPLGARVNQTI
jgi:hypothetical protein